jgi:hypothetical protein
MVLLGLLSGYGIARGQTDITNTLYEAQILITNFAADLFNFPAAFDVSGAALVDGSFIRSDGLNAVVLKGSADIPSMPPTNRIGVEGFVVEENTVFTEYTTEALSAAEFDVPLLATVPVTGDAVYVGMHQPGRIATFVIAQPSGHDVSMTWEYWQGADWAPLFNINDQTVNFTRTGVRTISWDMPTDILAWETSVITGSAVDAYWARGRVTAVNAIGQQPLGTRVFWENGQWWTWVQELAQDAGEQYTLYVGGPQLIPAHQIFPGPAGIVTPDHPDLEPGDLFAIEIDGRLRFTNEGEGVCLICKGEALKVYISSAASRAITVAASGSAVTEFTLSDITLPVGGTQTIILQSDGDNLTLQVGNQSAGGAAQDIVDEASDWVFAAGTSLVYFDQIQFYRPDFESFSSQAEWDSGTLANTITTETPDYSAGTFYLMPTSGPDDGRWTDDTLVWDDDNNNLTFGTISGPASQNTFVRFPFVPLEQGESVPSMALSLRCETTNTSTTVNALVVAIAEDNATAPTSAADANGRDTTAASVEWNSVPSCVNTATQLTTPDISSVIQEVVDRPGWEYGNALVVYILNNGSSAAASRSVRSWNRYIAFSNIVAEANLPRIPLSVVTTVAGTGILPEARDRYGPIFGSGNFGRWCDIGEFLLADRPIIGRVVTTQYGCNAFLRFTEVQLGQNEPIQRAYLMFNYEPTFGGLTDSGLLEVAITAISAGDASAPTTYSEAVNAERTDASVNHLLLPLTAASDGTVDQRLMTADITPVIEEILAHPGWDTNNAIVLLLEYTDSDAARTFTRTIASPNDACLDCDGMSATLVIVPSGRTAIPPDYIQLEPHPSGTVPFWDVSAVGTVHPSRLSSAYGPASLRMFASGGVTRLADQRFEAEEGQVWSVAVAAKVLTAGASSSIHLRWLDATEALISSSSQTKTTGTWSIIGVNGQTAPAATAWMELRLQTGSTASFSNTSFFDGAIACICATAGDFPDLNNLVENPSFERYFRASGTWTSPAINFPSATDVATTRVLWVASFPGNTCGLGNPLDTSCLSPTYTVEGSINDGDTWNVIETSGDPMPGITPGQDISALNLRVRVSLEASGGQEATYAFSLLQVQVVGTNELDYFLATLPSETLSDQSGNSHHGEMSFPVPIEGVVATMGPLTPRRGAVSAEQALGVPEVAGAVPPLDLFAGCATGVGLPLYDLLVQLSSLSGLPLCNFWLILLGLLIILAGAAAFIWTGGSVFMAAVIMGFGLAVGAVVGGGLIPGWTVLFYAPIAMAMVLFRRVLPI